GRECMGHAVVFHMTACGALEAVEGNITIDQQARYLQARKAMQVTRWFGKDVHFTRRRDTQMPAVVALLDRRLPVIGQPLRIYVLEQATPGKIARTEERRVGKE